MEFGKKNLSSGNSDFDKETYPVFEHIHDMYEVIVCDKTSPKASCLNRTCDDCVCQNCPSALMNWTIQKLPAE